MKEEVIYYKFKKGFWAYIWLIFDIVALLAMFKCFWVYAPAYIGYMITALVLLAAHLGVWLYKYAADNEMAVITDKDIKIDHNNPIAWKDIAYAEEKIVRCCGKDRKIISLVPHDGIDYKYNWLQLHNTGFTAFSIPLYGIISKEDEAKIIKIIDKKIGIKAAKAQKGSAAKKATAKKTPAKKAAVKKAPVKKEPAKKAPAKKAAPVKKAAPKSKAVKKNKK